MPSNIILILNINIPFISSNGRVDASMKLTKDEKPAMKRQAKKMTANTLPPRNVENKIGIQMNVSPVLAGPLYLKVSKTVFTV